MLTAKIKTKANGTSETDKAFVKVWKQQITNINKALTKLIEKIGTDTGEIPIFEGFHQALESPIDLDYSSQYIKLEQDDAEIHDKITQSSSANSFSASGGGGFGLFSAKASASHSWSKDLARGHL